jgi:hypothetical protein
LPPQRTYPVNLSCKCLQQVPGQPVLALVGKDQALALKLPDENGQRVEIGDLAEASALEIRKHPMGSIYSQRNHLCGFAGLSVIKGRCRHNSVKGCLLIQDVSLDEGQHQLAD